MSEKIATGFYINIKSKRTLNPSLMAICVSGQCEVVLEHPFLKDERYPRGELQSIARRLRPPALFSYFKRPCALPAQEGSPDEHLTIDEHLLTIHVLYTEETCATDK